MRRRRGTRVDASRVGPGGVGGGVRKPGVLQPSGLRAVVRAADSAAGAEGQ